MVRLAWFALFVTRVHSAAVHLRQHLADGDVNGGDDAHCMHTLVMFLGMYLSPWATNTRGISSILLSVVKWGLEDKG